MIVETFDRKSSLIIIPVTIKVDDTIKKLFFALDTGATITKFIPEKEKKLYLCGRYL